MNARLTQLVSLLALIALISGMAGVPARAAIITLTGGDAADASDGIGYAPALIPVYAYRITGNATVLNNAVGGPDPSAVTYRGITFQPLFMSGGEGAKITATTTSGDGNVKITDGFAYPAGAGTGAASIASVGTGGGSLSSDDTALFNIAKYQSFAAPNYDDTNDGDIQTLKLGGLVAGRTYQVDLFSANNYGGSEYFYTMQGAGAALPTDVVSVNGSNVENRVAGIVYDVREDVVAALNSIDNTGFITITATDNGTVHNDHAPINGFSVELTPEPASMALLASGSLMLLRRRRA